MPAAPSGAVGGVRVRGRGRARPPDVSAQPSPERWLHSGQCDCLAPTWILELTYLGGHPCPSFETLRIPREHSRSFTKHSFTIWVQTYLFLRRIRSCRWLGLGLRRGHQGTAVPFLTRLARPGGPRKSPRPHAAGAGRAARVTPSPTRVSFYSFRPSAQGEVYSVYYNTLYVQQ